ncbi:MFS transporter [Bifidobacterium oedipodis]|uniref:MFS transporter n=1 Tax=Bifidobacterium oedipodis TaxID=2675322 RepID=A0A7Y0ERN9_9BIFI|nr:MFS transporter [Bifidobacterium sp. DSM 109957]NMM94091.1 MFS transporter [Bifidobacterium sp. DSM 109957]
MRIKKEGFRHVQVPMLLAGQTASLLGSSIVQYAIVWYIVMSTNSGLTMTLVLIIQCLPQSLISLLGGVWADRWNRKLLIILPDAVIAIITVFLSIGFALGDVGVPFILCALALRSAGAGIQTPAVQAFIPEITPEDKLLRVNAINGTLQSINMIASPAIAAVLVNVLPIWSIMLVDVCTAVVGIVLVAAIRCPAVQSSAQTDRITSVDATQSIAGVWQDLRAGMAYVWTHTRVRIIIIGYMVMCIVNTAPMNLTLLLINRVWQHATLQLGFVSLSTSADKLGADQFAWSLGMVLGGAFLSSVGSTRIRNTMVTVGIAFGCMGLFTIGLGIAPNLLAYLIIDFLVGVATSFASSPVFTMLQTETDESMLGRTFGLLTAFSTFGTPIGMLVFGPLSDAIPVQAVFVMGGLLTLPVAIWVCAGSRRRVQR